MDKDILRKFLEEELVNHGVADQDDAEEVADSVVDRCDEEGFFEEDVDEDGF